MTISGLLNGEIEFELNCGNIFTPAGSNSILNIENALEARYSKKNKKTGN